MQRKREGGVMKNTPTAKSVPRFKTKQGRDTQHGHNPEREAYMEHMIRFVREYERERKNGTKKAKAG